MSKAHKIFPGNRETVVFWGVTSLFYDETCSPQHLWFPRDVEKIIGKKASTVGLSEDENV